MLLENHDFIHSSIPLRLETCSIHEHRSCRPATVSVSWPLLGGAPGVMLENGILITVALPPESLDVQTCRCFLKSSGLAWIDVLLFDLVSIPLILDFTSVSNLTSAGVTSMSEVLISLKLVTTPRERSMPSFSSLSRSAVESCSIAS